MSFEQTDFVGFKEDGSSVKGESRMMSLEQQGESLLAMSLPGFLELWMMSLEQQGESLIGLSVPEFFELWMISLEQQGESLFEMSLTDFLEIEEVGSSVSGFLTRLWMMSFEQHGGDSLL